MGHRVQRELRPENLTDCRRGGLPVLQHLCLAEPTTRECSGQRLPCIQGSTVHPDRFDCEDPQNVIAAQIDTDTIITSTGTTRSLDREQLVIERTRSCDAYNEYGYR